MYEIVLREPGGTTLIAKALDDVLYPKALAWTRLLSSDRGRQADANMEALSWRKRGHEAFYELATSGLVKEADVDAFIKAAATSGIVQVELTWEKESVGWAARVFPWEQLIALATKDERLKQGNRPLTVVRYLKYKNPPQGLHGSPTPRKGTVFTVTEEAENLGYKFAAERAAIQEALGEEVPLVKVSSLGNIGEASRAWNPQRLHLVTEYDDSPNELFSAEKAAANDRIATAVASIGAELVVYSFCHTGKRLAPLTVSKGVKFVIGFHGMVMDSSLPVFFGAFYQALWQEPDVLAALQAGLVANNRQPDPSQLGSAVLWSAESLIETPKAAARAVAKPAGDSKTAAALIPETELVAALPIICEVEETVNYSVLHNSKGGLFKDLRITKIKEGRLDKALEISVTLDTGLDRPSSCRYCIGKPFEATHQHDLAAKIVLPLGAQLLRQRGETIIGTVEVTIKYGGLQLFHEMQSIKLLPCDEWRDDESGRHLLPSFVFPRDPSVREVITAAQPYLRALRDDPQGGFDGYQQNSTRAVMHQAKAVWSALQHTYHLHYVNPPPTYTVASQRLRTPEEVLRAKRGTCIELALLLAACWEHVGILPVVFLTRGHAFAGFWTSVEARSGVISELPNLMQHAEPEQPFQKEIPPSRSSWVAGHLKRFGNLPKPAKPAAQGRNDGKAKEAWMFAEDHHLSAIRSAVDDGALVPLETTYIPLQKPYAESMRDAAELLAKVPASHFDGMLDVQSAREKGVTPLAIIFEGIVA